MRGRIGAIALAFAVAMALSANEAVALNFTVNSTADTTDGNCDAAPDCTLREAIIEANALAGPDTIDFSIAGAAPHMIAVAGAELPPITTQVTVDGTTEPDYDDAPVIEVDGQAADPFTSGLQLSGGGSGGSVIRGLAINQFSFAGILIQGSNGNAIESNFLGPDITGTASEANLVGLDIAGTSGANVIGGDLDVEGNRISGNNNGIFLRGTGGNNRVENNLIGPLIGAGPEQSGNGARGIVVDDGASGDSVGDMVNADLANTIAGNGTGLAVATADVLVGLNSFVENDTGIANAGLGIDLGVDYLTPNDVDDPDIGPNDFLNFPELDIASVDSSGKVTVAGTVDLPPGTVPPVVMGIYASESCDPSGFGEGEMPLGVAQATSVVDGEVDFAESLTGDVDSGDVITATTSILGVTSEFSQCLEAIGPPSIDDDEVVAGPVSGTILIKLPGSDVFGPLDEQMQIPEGTIVDATDGEVRIVSEAPTEPGGTREATFSQGQFKVKQLNKSPFITEALLVGGEDCPTRRATKGAASKLRRLLARGRGGHRSRGSRGSGTVRGTEWYTEDRCNGSTFFEVFEGSIKVKDFTKKKTVIVEAGETYTAKKKQRN